MMKPQALLFALLATASLLAEAASAEPLKLTNLDVGNAKMDGQSVNNAISPELSQSIIAEGRMPLENPSKINGYYGYSNDGPLSPASGDSQTKDHNVEATKTEPDKNTYLVMDGQKGPDANYNYGSHFLFQGHEHGISLDGRPHGYVTRINLDADARHRVTLLAEMDSSGSPLPFIDGSAWNPFAKRLMLTGEDGEKGGLWQVTADYPATADDLRGISGIGAYEGVQLDNKGNLWLVEDTGGKKGKIAKHARLPNSFVYRLVPNDPTNITKGGRLEVLQVSASDGQPIVFNTTSADADISSAAVKEMYSYGKSLKTRWIVIHDTAKDGSAPFDANKLAKAAGGTPMKRPENGQFRPASAFTEFYFTATGDTNSDSEAGAEGGGYGGIFVLKQTSATANEGVLQITYRGDREHTGFDNLAFLTANQLAIVEDAGDTLHSQRKAFDAGYIIDVTADYSSGVKPLRFLVNGRDAAATVDSGLVTNADDNGFQNDGDNEITGFHVSDGDPSIEGLIGTKSPTPFKDGWRVFYTRQHGKNETYEVKGSATM
jgi:hypothetical protein